MESVKRRIGDMAIYKEISLGNLLSLLSLLLFEGPA